MMSPQIDAEDPVAYYKKVADELERIAETIKQRPELNHSLSARLLAFAEQIRRDSAIAITPEMLAGAN